MKPIGKYVDVCKEMTEEKFCKRCPHPFLLHSMLVEPMIPTDATRGITMDRLVLSDGGNRGEGAPSQEEAYTVFAVQPRNPRDDRITLGCSSTCDVQVNDTSISTLHATIERYGDRYLVRDNESAAGTQVNDEVLEPSKPRELEPGDRVTLGYVDLMFLRPAEFYQFVRRFFEI